MKYSEIIETSYRGDHAAPDPDTGSPLYDVTLFKTYPVDFYDHTGFRYYADQGRPDDRLSYDKIKSCKDQPNKLITIFRAIPKNVYKDIMKMKDINYLDHLIRNGDWVTGSKQYAKDHGEAEFGRNNYKLVFNRVPAKYIFTNGDSIHEWGYYKE